MVIQDSLTEFITDQRVVDLLKIPDGENDRMERMRKEREMYEAYKGDSA